MPTLTPDQVRGIMEQIRSDPQKMKLFCDAIRMDMYSLTKEAIQYIESTIGFLRTQLRTPVHTSILNGADWVSELLDKPSRCYNAFRMNRDTFLLLVDVLENKYNLQYNNRLAPKEKVAIFVYTLAHKSSVTDAMERFQRSRSTIHRHFEDVLDAVHVLGGDIVRPRLPFNAVPHHIICSPYYYPYFKDCVGALDGCHIQLIVGEHHKLRFIGRKGYPTTNVLAICDFDLIFTFVCARWEGTAHDSRVLTECMFDPALEFPMPREGKYYLADKGYADRDCIMTPHTGDKYHQAQFRAEDARGPNEYFNKCHSSLRSSIERAFGVLKGKWQILECVPNYKTVNKQTRVINACFTLHNFCRLSKFGDPASTIVNNAPEIMPDEEIDPDDDDNQDEEDNNHNMADLRNQIINLMQQHNGNRGRRR